MGLARPGLKDLVHHKEFGLFLAAQESVKAFKEGNGMRLVKDHDAWQQ